MPRKRPKKSIFSFVECEIDTSNDNFDKVFVLPNPDDSGHSDDSGSDDEVYKELLSMTYREACKNYIEDQTKLEKDHEYNWIDGELCYPDVIDDNLLLTESQKKKKKDIQMCEPVQLFEKIFSIEMKRYIIETCTENKYILSLDNLNTFIGIVILSSINKKKSQRDYWSFDPFLS